jgi:DNA end-binding protein Ku
MRLALEHRIAATYDSQRQMPAAVWTGSLSLGLVVVPVRLYPAIKKKTVRFHEVDRVGRRIRHVRVADPEIEWEARPYLPNEPVFPPSRDLLSPGPTPLPDPLSAEEREPLGYEEVRKGYEVAPGEYVSLTREEVAELAPERSRVIDVQQFVDTSAVDPVYFESRYYVVPDRDFASPFRLLRQALAGAEKMAIAWFTLRSRRYLCVVRPFGEVMLLTTMVHADEVVPADFWLPNPNAEPTDKELKMARLLIDTLSGPFEPERYPDEHRQRLLDAIAARTPEMAPSPVPSPTKVMDLMAALEASVKAAKAARAAQPAPAVRSRKGSKRQAG